MTLCEIELLGHLQIVQQGRVITRFRSRKFGALLAYLALSPTRLHSRELLIELLWPEIDPEAGRTNLRQAIASLRRQLEPPQVTPGSVLRADRLQVQLNPAAIATDVARFEAAVATAAEAVSAEERAERLRAAVAFYGGELLPGFTDVWVLAERQRLLQRYLDALDAIVSLLDAAGQTAEAISYARRAVSADPLREEGQHTLIRLLAGSGQAEAALRQYRELEQLLARELGLTPGEEIRALAREIARGREPSRREPDAPPSLPAKRVPTADTHASETEDLSGKPASPERRASGEAAPLPRTGFLPLPLTRFFGREEEIARLANAFGTRRTALAADAPASTDSRESTMVGRRLVTLTGPGGSGKTRLALQVAARLADAGEVTAWWVPLVDLADPRYIGDRLLSALGLPWPREREPLEPVITFLTTSSTDTARPALLLLDNYEHLLPDGVEAVRTLLERVPALRVLATSRRALGLPGEQEFPVAPLPVPAADISGCPSVQLFLDRAHAVRPDFQLAAARAATIARLCARLEGLPLAIELAAARIAVLTPAQMLARLEQRFDLLTSHGRPADPRHRSLRATLDWSYHLLSPELQRFFARLSVFRGGWNLEAAEAVCGEPRALDFLDQLRAASLVVSSETGDEMRYRLLETLREYGWERLQSEEERIALRGQHRDWFLAVAVAFQSGVLKGPELAAAIERLEREHDNLRAALFWAVETGELRQGLQAGYHLGSFCFLQGNWSEGREWLGALLEQPGSAEYPALRAQVLSGAASFAGGQGDREAARRFYVEALQLGRSLANEEIIGTSLQGLGAVAYALGDFETARTCHEENLAAGRALNNPTRIKAGLHGLGVMAEWQGDAETAEFYYRELLTFYCAEGNEVMIAWGFHGLGVCAHLRGDRQEAWSLLQESRRRFQVMGHQAGAAAALYRLGILAGDQGDFDQASDLHRESLRLAHRFGDSGRIAENLDALAACVVEQGHGLQAARLAGAAAALRERHSIAALLPGAVRLQADELRARLGGQAFDAAWADGQAAPLEQILESALREERRAL